MNAEWKQTSIFAAAAVVLTGAALFSRSSIVNKPPGLADEALRTQNTEFFPGFTDPLACTSLEVIDVDEDTATATPFKVMLKNKQWVIPSHYDYPADAKDRLAKTASGVISLRRDKIASVQQADQERLGVIDPLSASGTGKGAGKRVTLRDKNDNVLADFIIGKEVSGNPKQRYVRVPSEKWTYAVNVDVDLSTKFADWIETNLLKIDTSKVRKVTFDGNKATPSVGGIRLQKGEVLTIERKDASAPWTMSGLEPAKELNTDALNTLVTALGDLKIVGVRTKPEGLTHDLKSRDGRITLDEDTTYSLANRGFYLMKSEGLMSNQGEVRVECEDGAAYILRFGDAIFEKGESLTKGKVEKKGDKKEDAPKKEGLIESRFVFVTASFDPDLLPADKPAKLEPAEKLPDDVFLAAPDDPKRVADQKAADEKRAATAAERQKTIDKAKKSVEERTDRFAPWYYVVPGDAFRNIQLDRAKLVRDKGAKPAGGRPDLSIPPGLDTLPTDLLPK